MGPSLERIGGSTREGGGGSTVVSLYPIACNILFESNMFALVALVLDPLAGPSMPSEA